MTQSNMTPPAVLYEKRDAIAWITLNRSDALNSINADMREQLQSVLADAAADKAVRVLVLKGAEGRAFCSGADIKGFSLKETPAEFRASRVNGHWIRAFERVQKPIIAALHGYCLGGGLEIAMACDIRIAADDCQLGLPEVTLGTIPGAGGTQRLARLVGLGHALDMILTGERINAARALSIGLVTRVVTREQLLPATEALALRMASLAPLAQQHAKEAVIRGIDLPLAEGLGLELALASLLVGTLDRDEAVRAFGEKRTPVFVGR